MPEEPKGTIFMSDRKVNILNLSLLPWLEPSKKFLVGGWGGVESDFSVMLWAKPEAFVYASAQAKQFLNYTFFLDSLYNICV